MATIRRPPPLDGKPSITTLPRLELQGMQQALTNIRSRLDKLDVAVNKAYVVLDASKTPQDLASLQQQIVALQKQLEILALSIAGLGDQEADEDPSQGAVNASMAELQKSVQDLRTQPADDLRAVVAELSKKVEELQTAPPSDTGALFLELEKRVEGLEQGVLA